KLRIATEEDALESVPTSQKSCHPSVINKSLIYSVVRRVVWYPVVPLVVQFFNNLLETYAYTHKVVSFPLLLLCNVCLSLHGLLNALVFSQDIAVTRAFQDIKLSWWISNVNSYESHYPHLSRNKAITDEFSMIRKSSDFVELKTINYNKVDIIKKNIITDDITDIINVDIYNDITNNNLINNIVNSNSINNNNNSNNSTNNRVINNNNNGLVVQPSPLEWLRYMLLIKLFSVPRFSSRLISPRLLSPANSCETNQKKDSKRDSKQDITLNNQNND
ncbi:16138_t:CDS:2, partial [Racocetra persica]